MNRRLSKNARADAGFTLLEIVVALGILATAMVILIESHYGSLRIFDTAQDTLILDSFMEHAIGAAEPEVLSGTLEGDGDFGRRYLGYSYSFSAEAVNEEEMAGLFEVTVTVQGPQSMREMNFLAFDGALGDG